MNKYLLLSQIVLSVLITVLILLQSQGASLGAMWRGGGETYHTRRGLEKVIFYLTMVLIGVFTLVAIFSLINS